MINVDVYRVAYKLKKAQVFAVSMRDLEYQAKKKAKPEIDLKNIIQKDYHDLLDLFIKKNSDIFLPYQKYNYKIILDKEQKHNHTPFYQILP